MDANFAISKQDGQLLELRYRPSARAWVGLGMLGMGAAIVYATMTQKANMPFQRGAWALGLATLGATMVLCGIHALLNRKTVMVDRVRHAIEIDGWILGLMRRKVVIPFGDVAGVELQHHLESLDSSPPYWEIILRGRGRFGGRVLDASSDEHYVARIGKCLADLIGCPLSRSEFSVAAKRKRAATV